MVEVNWYTMALIIFLLLLLFIKLFFASKQERYKNLPPGPPGLPILGHLHLLKEPLYKTLQAFSDKYGPIILLRFGPRKVLVVTSPSAVEECFTKNDIVFANRPQTLHGKHLSYNNTTMGTAPYGDLWRNLRRITTLEIFSTSQLERTSSIRGEEVKFLINELMKNCDGGYSKVDLNSKFFELSFNVMTMMIVGKRFYGESVEDVEEAKLFHNLMREYFELAKSSSPADLFPVLQWVDLFGTERKMVAIAEKMDKFLQKLVDERRKMEASKKLKKTLIDSLLSWQETEPEFYTNNIINGIISVLLIAGIETSSTAMEWAMSLLLNHPNAMTKVRAEIEAHVGPDHLLDEQDLSKLDYLSNVVKEALRLYSPAPLLVPHESSEDCTVGGYDVPRGTMLMVNVLAIHRDPMLWENPTKFMPERFEAESSGDGYRLIPFGSGRRGCPGATLANRIVGLTLGALIQSFEWKRVDEEEVDMAESFGISMPKLKPLEAICKPCPSKSKQCLV